MLSFRLGMVNDFHCGLTIFSAAAKLIITHYY